MSDKPTDIGRTEIDEPAHQQQAPLEIEVDHFPENEMPIAPLASRATTGFTSVAEHRPSRWMRVFLQLVLAFVAFVIGVAAWDFVVDLIARFPVLGWAAAAIGGLILVLVAFGVLRELSAISRLRKIETLRADVIAARGSHDTSQAKLAAQQVERF